MPAAKRVRLCVESLHFETATERAEGEEGLAEREPGTSKETSFSTPPRPGRSLVAPYAPRRRLYLPTPQVEKAKCQGHASAQSAARFWRTSGGSRGCLSSQVETTRTSCRMAIDAVGNLRTRILLGKNEEAKVKAPIGQSVGPSPTSLGEPSAVHSLRLHQVSRECAKEVMESKSRPPVLPYSRRGAGAQEARGEGRRPRPNEAIVRAAQQPAATWRGGRCRWYRRHVDEARRAAVQWQDRGRGCRRIRRGFAGVVLYGLATGPGRAKDQGASSANTTAALQGRGGGDPFPFVAPCAVHRAGGLWPLSTVLWE